MTSAVGLTIEEATGAFIVSAALITLVGFSGWFERAMDRIPVAIASGMRRLAPRYGVIAALAVGVAMAAGQGLLRVDETRPALAAPVWVTPRFSAGALIGVALPLFIVTMASQNVPGVAVIRGEREGAANPRYVVSTPPTRARSRSSGWTATTRRGRSARRARR